MNRHDVLLLDQAAVARLLPMRDAVDAVEAAFRQHGLGELPMPGVLAAHAERGGFHIKAAVSRTASRRYFAAKTNANFPDNPLRAGLPTIQGLVLLFDAADGRPLAVLDSIEITVLRTAAATAVAARHLARRDSRAVTIFGCGAQAAAQLSALQTVLPLDRCFAFDVDPVRRAAFARAAGARGLRCETPSIDSALAESDVVVTCTPSTGSLFAASLIRPGTFVAAVGADNPEKQELDPALFSGATVVVDLLDQCAEIGDLHHALDVGTITRAGVHGELGAIAAGAIAGRRTRDEITIFDSTGTALQDAAAAAIVYERAIQEGRSLRWVPASAAEEPC